MIKEKFYKNIMKVFMGSAGAQAIWVLSMLVVSHLYTADCLGVQQLFISGATMLAAIASGRYELAITSPKYRFQAINLFVFSLLLTFAISLLLFIGTLPFNEIIASFIGLGNGECILLPVYVAEICWYMICYAWLVREKRYVIASKGLMLFPFAYLMLCITLSGMNIPVSTLVLTIILARGLELLYYGIYIYRDLRQYFDKISFFSIVKQGREYIDFPKYLVFGGFVDNGKNNIVPFFITRFWGNAATGYYSLANQCLSAPVGLIGKSVGDVFRQEASVLWNKNKKCNDFYLRNLYICVGYSVGICVIVFFLSPIVIPLLLGGKWEDTVIYIQVMLPMSLLMLVSSPLSNIYIVSRQQKKYIYIQILDFVGSIIGMFFGGYSGFSVEITLLIWSIISAFVSVISIGLGKKISEGNVT